MKDKVKDKVRHALRSREGAGGVRPKRENESGGMRRTPNASRPPGSLPMKERRLILQPGRPPVLKFGAWSFLEVWSLKFDVPLVFGVWFLVFE
ncbi:MAG: hypothetical protein C5B50_24545 [Verrucomicrobia bacterium]|nr:MAG: hypothetical protein C5B50_24545 [Verrucomicrobiota bacterium]